MDGYCSNLYERYCIPVLLCPVPSCTVLPARSIPMEMKIPDTFIFLCQPPLQKLYITGIAGIPAICSGAGMF